MPAGKNRDLSFTLIELIAVMAAAAILTALLFPTISAVKRSVLAAKTKAMFARYALAYGQFRAEKHYYPSMGAPESARFDLNGGGENNAVFIQTLSGRKKNGGEADHPYALRVNPKKFSYCVFTEGDFAPPGSQYAGRIADAFGNPNIVAVADLDQNGVIAPEDFAPGDLEGLPLEERGLPVHAGVVFISSNAAANSGWQWVYSWK